MTSAKEEMTVKTGPSTQDEEELGKKEDNSKGKDEEETNDEELLEQQEEGGEDVKEVEQEVNEKGEQRLSEEKVEAPSMESGGGDNTETKTAPSKKEKPKKGEAATNVNNEVVKMRAEVKRVRALLIRKLLRHLADLKKKKGNEADLERNKRRVERLQEEIRQMKRLKPDQVRLTAPTT